MSVIEQRREILFKVGATLVILLLVLFAVKGLFVVYTDQIGTIWFAFILAGIGTLALLLRRFPNLGDKERECLSGSWWGVITHTLLGLVMAGLVYVIFMSGIVTGDGGKGLVTTNLFPKFFYPKNDADTVMNFQYIIGIRPATIQEFGKLLVWSFLAGYSERFVPSLVECLENRVGGGQ